MRKTLYAIVFVLIIGLTACSKNAEHERISTINDFIKEFFTPNLDSRLTVFENAVENTADEDKFEASVIAYHKGIEPYLTQNALEKIMNNRTLYVYDQIVVSSGCIEIANIDIKEIAGEEDIYSFVVSVDTESAQLVFHGQIILEFSGDNPLISNFYLPL